MKKSVGLVIVTGLIILLLLVSYKWDYIFQKGNPIPYLMAASKITENNPYVEVDKNIFISKRGNYTKLFEDFEDETGFTFDEQGGSSFIFTDGHNNYIISSEIYWRVYTVWKLPIIE